MDTPIQHTEKTLNFIKKAKEKHGDIYDYSQSIYIDKKTKLKVVCKIHDVFLKTPSSHYAGFGCNKCGRIKQSKTVIENHRKTFIDRANVIHNSKYDYSLSNYINHATKLEIICPVHNKFLQSPRCHLEGKGCDDCGRITRSKKIIDKYKEQFVDRANTVHEFKYDYSLTNYKGADQQIVIICRKHGQYTQSAHGHLSGNGCRKCSKNMLSTREWVEIAIQVHGTKYDYTETEFLKTSEHLVINCVSHGKFSQIAYLHLNGSGCPSCAGKHHRSPKEWIEYAENIRGDKYDYSETIFIKNSEPVTIICPIHQRKFLQYPSIHLKGADCPICAGTYSPSTSEWILRARAIHQDKYDYSRTHYTKSNEILLIHCRQHGDFFQQASSHLAGHGCRTCSGKYSPSTEEWIQRAINVHKNRYSYENTHYFRSDSLVKIFCTEHGQYKQIAGSHLMGAGCPSCAGNVPYTTESWIEKSKSIYGEDRFDYSKTIYNGLKNSIILICKNHAEFKVRNSGKHLYSKRCCPKCQMCSKCGLFKTNGQLCSYCKPLQNNKKYMKTKEMKVVLFLREKIPDQEFIHNKSVGSQCTEGHLFPDILFECYFFYIIVEVDENRHRGSSYSCEQARMFDIISKLGSPCIFIRYNPDSKKSSLNTLLSTIQGYLNLSFEDKHPWDDFGFFAEYLFY